MAGLCATTVAVVSKQASAADCRQSQNSHLIDPGFYAIANRYIDKLHVRTCSKVELSLQ